MSTKLNDEHERAVREVRQKVGAAVATRAAEQARKSTGWQRVVWWLVAAGGAVVAWWYGPGLLEQQQPTPTPPAPAAEISNAIDQ